MLCNCETIGLTITSNVLSLYYSTAAVKLDMVLDSSIGATKGWVPATGSKLLSLYTTMKAAVRDAAYPKIYPGKMKRPAFPLAFALTT